MGRRKWRDRNERGQREPNVEILGGIILGEENNKF